MTGIRRWRLSDRQNVNGTITIVMRYNNNNIMWRPRARKTDLRIILPPTAVNPFHYWVLYRYIDCRLATTTRQAYTNNVHCDWNLCFYFVSMFLKPHIPKYLPIISTTISIKGSSSKQDVFFTSMIKKKNVAQYCDKKNHTHLAYLCKIAITYLVCTVQLFFI